MNTKKEIAASAGTTMPKVTETTLEIDLTALRHNYQYISAKLNPHTKMLGVVKAFGYGSDAIAIAKELVQLGVDYFAVAYANEGVALRNAGIQTPILVLHTLPIHYKTIVEHCLEPSIYSLKLLESFTAFARKAKLQAYPVHLKFNTGLNRLGFAETDVITVANVLQQCSQTLKIQSILSHLAASEDPKERVFTEKQLTAFSAISKTMETLLGYAPMLHTLNTSGILNYPEAQYNMVRTGIGLYGFGNDTAYDQHLIPVATLKTVISQIHLLDKGDTVGYNRAGHVIQPTKTATLPIGHADGISRSYGNGKGWVTIQGKKAPFIGNVCMDMIMVDVTNIDCQEGDEVIVFGKETTAENLANVVDSISYELLTAISQRVKRVIRRN